MIMLEKLKCPFSESLSTTANTIKSINQSFVQKGKKRRNRKNNLEPVQTFKTTPLQTYCCPLSRLLFNFKMWKCENVKRLSDSNLILCQLALIFFPWSPSRFDLSTFGSGGNALKIKKICRHGKTVNRQANFTNFGVRAQGARRGSRWQLDRWRLRQRVKGKKKVHASRYPEKNGSTNPCLRDLECVEGINCTVPVLLDTAHSKAVEDEEDAIELQGSGC